jgi:hypothetical protein
MIEVASQSASWDEWFEPFFKFVTENNDMVRAVSYINGAKAAVER